MTITIAIHEGIQTNLVHIMVNTIIYLFILSGTPFSITSPNRIRCLGTTMKGEQCKNSAIITDNVCRKHLPKTIL